MVWPDTQVSLRTVQSAMGRAVAATASLKKVPGPRDRVPLPRHAPDVQGPVCVGVTVETVMELEVAVALVIREPSAHWVTAG